MKARSVYLGCLSIAASLIMPAALADAGPWYGVVGAGATSYGGPNGTYNLFLGSVSPSGFHSTSHYSNSATAWTLDVGYRFNPYLAVEGSYVDFGSAGSTFASAPPSTSYSGGTHVRGEVLEAVGSLPIGTRFALFAKAGLLHYKSDINEYTVSVDPTTSPPTVIGTMDTLDSTTGTTADLGIGPSLSLTDRFSLRAGVTYFRGKTNSHAASGLTIAEMPGIHLTSLELLYSFD